MKYTDTCDINTFTYTLILCSLAMFHKEKLNIFKIIVYTMFDLLNAVKRKELKQDNEIRTLKII